MVLSRNHQYLLLPRIRERASPVGSRTGSLAMKRPAAHGSISVSDRWGEKCTGFEDCYTKLIRAGRSRAQQPADHVPPNDVIRLEIAGLRLWIRCVCDPLQLSYLSGVGQVSDR